MMNKKFYAHGKYFDNEAEFWKFCQDWPFEKVSEESFNDIMNLFVKNISLNMEIYGSDMTNGAFNDIMEQNFLSLMQDIIPNGK